MHLNRLSILLLLLWGWLGLSLPAPALAQATPGVKAPPTILEFDRKFCPICKASEHVILAVRDRFPGQFVVRKFYIDEEEGLFRRYRVAIVPTQVFLDAAGHEVGRHEGVYKQADLIQKLREMKFIRD
jgi:thioredoxin 1